MLLITELHTGIKVKSPLEIGIAIHEELLEMERKSQAKPFPRVGDTLAIRHQVKRTSAGDVLGIQRADGRPTSARITAVYLDGSVRTGHSEVWNVRPGTVGHWETINPDRVERG